MADHSENLWKAWADGHMAVQRCDSCGRTQHPPAQVCGECHGRQLNITDIDGTGRLVTWSTVHRAPSPEFASEVPYTVCVVALPDGALIEARLAAGVRPEIGTEVQLRIRSVAGRAVPVADQPTAAVGSG